MASPTPPFWRDRPTLVTGATGLVGGYVVNQLLSLGSDVVCLVRDWVPRSELVRSKSVERTTVIRGELEDQALLERVLNEQEITTVIHLGAQAVVGTANRNPVSTFESNVRGTWSLLEACRRSPLVCAIVLASSDKAYGEQPMLPYTEDMPLLARNPYDVSKSCAEMVAQSYVTAFRLQIAIARCGNFFGAGDLNWNRIVPGTIRSILRGERPVIRSDGTFIRDYFYAADGALAYLLLAEALTARPELAGEAFNFSHEKPLTVLEVVDTILRLMGSELRPDVKNSAMNEIHRQYLSAAKARRVLGWEPKNSLEEGLDATIRWYESLLRS